MNNDSELKLFRTFILHTFNLYWDTHSNLWKCHWDLNDNLSIRFSNQEIPKRTVCHFFWNINMPYFKYYEDGEYYIFEQFLQKTYFKIFSALSTCLFYAAFMTEGSSYCTHWRECRMEIEIFITCRGVAYLDLKEILLVFLDSLSVWWWECMFCTVLHCSFIFFNHI